MDTSSDTDEEIINFYDCSGDEEDTADENSSWDIRNNNNNQIVVHKYELLTTSGLIYSMKNDIQKVVNVLFVSEPIARCLLNHFKWNVEQLVNDYYDTDDLNAFFDSAGIDNPASLTYTIPDAIIECGICFTPFTETRATGFVCGHQFCESCCCQYFEAKVLNDGEGNMIKCPDPDCKILIEDATILDLIHETTKNRFETLITRNFVTCNPLLRYCRSEDCEYAIKVKKVESIPVICKCGFESCFQCGEMWHDSVTCALLKKWIRCSTDDSESYKWMEKNAKQCPNCKMNIEKNGGCNHMSCISCRHEFCWVCMQDWRQHRSCNQFEQTDENMVERLEHYSLRYNNHIQSVKLERGLYSSVETRMKNLQGMASLTRNEVLFLKCAVESLRRSRQILISTYVFAFYSKKSNQLLIFEDNQRDLELATENLSWFLEQDITDESIVTIKQKLQEKYTYCDKRRNVLLDHIHEGYEKGYWKLDP